MISSSSISLKTDRTDASLRVVRNLHQRTFLSKRTSIASVRKYFCIGSLWSDSRRRPSKIGPRARGRIPKVIPVGELTKVQWRRAISDYMARLSEKEGIP